MGIANKVNTKQFREDAQLGLVREQLLAWYTEQISAENSPLACIPWRQPFVCSSSVLVGEMLLDRFTLGHACLSYYQFVNDHPHWVQIANSTVAEIRSSLPPTSTWRRRAFTLRFLAQLYLDDSQVLPPTLFELTQLPGISAITASLVRSIVFGVPEPQLCTELRRVLRRLRGETAASLPATASSEITQDAAALVKHPDHIRLNWALKHFANEICTPESPDCGHCPIRHLCQHSAK